MSLLSKVCKSSHGQQLRSQFQKACKYGLIRAAHLLQALFLSTWSPFDAFLPTCRYTLPTGGEHLDITYGNIRHAMYQEAENELISLIHFHLKNPIMVGKKKVLDVQFYTEVMTDTAAVRSVLLTSSSARALLLSMPCLRMLYCLVLFLSVLCLILAWFWAGLAHHTGMCFILLVAMAHVSQISM